MSDNVERTESGDLLYLRIASLVFGCPLLIRPQEAETIGVFLRRRMDGARHEANRFQGEQQFDESMGRWKGYRRVGTVGIVTITGELVNRGAWIGASSGLTSYEGIVEQMRQAASDQQVDSILLDIDSPGGMVDGCFETARTLRAMAADKRMVALANARMTSAAYALGSAADEIVITESSITGSIGVVMLHLDQSQLMEKLGVRASVIFSGENKPLGNPFEPLSKGDREKLQAKTDRVMQSFIRLVADHRPAMSEQAIRSQEAATYFGIDGIAAGLADRVGTFESVLEELTRAPSSGPRSTSQLKGTIMSEKTGAPAANQDAGNKQAPAPAGISQEQHEAAVKAARESGQKAEADRVAGVLSYLGRGHDETVRQMAADGKSSKADVAMAILEAQEKRPENVEKTLKNLDKAAEGVVSAPSAIGNGGGGTPSASTPEGWKAEWAASEKLKSEFVTADDYAGFKQAESSGKVRVLSRKTA